MEPPQCLINNVFNVTISVSSSDGHWTRSKAGQKKLVQVLDAHQAVFDFSTLCLTVTFMQQCLRKSFN